MFLPGAIENAISKYKDALLFVINSLFEGMPNVLMEAMAYGLPVISTDFYSGAAKEMITDGENGFLIPVDNEEALEEKIRLVLDSPHIAQSVAEKATEIFYKYNMNAVCHEWEKFLYGEN